jgi:hypothetical protein
MLRIVLVFGEISLPLLNLKKKVSDCQELFMIIFRKILSFFNPLSILIFFLTSTAYASVETLKPNGLYGWRMSNVNITYSKNACNSDIYQAGYESIDKLENVYEIANKHYYKGGACKSVETVTNQMPGTFPKHLSYEEYIASSSHSFRVFHYNFECVQDNDRKYTYEFVLEPIYTCESGGCYSEYPYCMADIVARELNGPLISGAGHTGLFAGTYVLEVLNNEKQIINLSPLDRFLSASDYWGSGYGFGKNNPEITLEQAVEILNTGLDQQQYNPIYTLSPLYMEGRYENYGDEIITVPGVFRCDSFVQYTYKKVLKKTLPPNAIHNLPVNQWNSLPFKRKRPNNDTLQSEIMESNLVQELFSDESLSDAEKSDRLINIHDRTADRLIQIAVYDALKHLHSPRNMDFLIKSYLSTNDDELKKWILQSIYMNYVYKMRGKDDNEYTDKVRAIFSEILLKSTESSLTREAIRVITSIFDSPAAYKFLKRFDLSDGDIRDVYITSFLVTLINERKFDEFFDFTENLDSCEIKSRWEFFEKIHREGLISSTQLDALRPVIKCAYL